MNTVAWHGQHDEAGFERQLLEIESVASAGKPAIILADVNRRPCKRSSSRGSDLQKGDRVWRNAVKTQDQARQGSTSTHRQTPASALECHCWAAKAKLHSTIV